MTKENCVELSKNCKSKSEFCRKYYMAYDYANKNKMLDILFPKKIITFEECVKESKKYKNRSEFGRWSTKFYNTCKNNGWLDIIFGKYENKPNKYWTKERCEEESKKYKSRNEFRKCSNGAYTKAKNNKWLDDYTWLQTPLIKIHRNETKNIIYAYEDKDYNVVYVGRTINLTKRHSQHNTLNYRTKKYDCIKEYFVNANKSLPKPIILEKVNTYIESQMKEKYWIEKYKSDGWVVLNKAKTGIGVSSIGGGYIKWTYDKCLEESKKYKTKMEFKKGSSGAYSSSVKNDWLKDFNFIEVCKPKRYWYNYENCLNEMKKYATKQEFFKKSQSAYNAALKMGWLKEYYK